jgi:hypothetical protein
LSIDGFFVCPPKARGEQVQEVEVAYGEVYADSAAESGAAHHSHDFDEASVEIRAACHEEKQASDRAKATSEARAVMRNNRDQKRRNATQRWKIQPDESQIRWDKDRGHAEYCDCESGENQASGAGA